MEKDLTAREIEVFKERLLKRKRDLWQEVRGHLRLEIDEEYQDLLKIPLDEEDKSVVDLKEETALSLIEPKKRELEEIEEALTRVERGEYGLCVDCSGPIGIKRLEIMPETPRCARCQARREKIEKKK
ncbi:MAG: TraR/DksA C4-type zinc finger protein [Thermodesulfobacteriota bacterium]